MKPGEHYLRFRILQKLGRGGFGDVYLAEDTESGNRRVALKSVGRGFDHDGELAQQAERFGAELQKRVRDSRVVHVYAYYAMNRGSLLGMAGRTLGTVASLPLFGALDVVDRKVFNEFFYRYYEGLSEDRLITVAEEPARTPAVGAPY